MGEGTNERLVYAIKVPNLCKYQNLDGIKMNKKHAKKTFWSYRGFGEDYAKTSIDKMNLMPYQSNK